jgi:hypothetical protein
VRMMPSPSCGAGRRHPLDLHVRRRGRAPEHSEPDAAWRSTAQRMEANR